MYSTVLYFLRNVQYVLLMGRVKKQAKKIGADDTMKVQVLYSTVPERRNGVSESE